MAEVMAGAWKWVYLNWITICVLTGLFLWKHTEVIIINKTITVFDVISALGAYKIIFMAF